MRPWSPAGFILDQFFQLWGSDMQLGLHPMPCYWPQRQLLWIPLPLPALSSHPHRHPDRESATQEQLTVPFQEPHPGFWQLPHMNMMSPVEHYRQNFATNSNDVQKVEDVTSADWIDLGFLEGPSSDYIQ